MWEAVGAGWREHWQQQVTECYPFHPYLIAIAREEWSHVTGFQRVRSTITRRLTYGGQIASTLARHEVSITGSIEGVGVGGRASNTAFMASDLVRPAPVPVVELSGDELGSAELREAGARP